MKAKYYRIREYLYGNEAAEYLGALTGVSLDSDDFFSIVNSHLPAYIDCLNEPFIGGEVDGLLLKVVPVGLQKVHSHLHWFNDSELRFCFNPPKSLLERDKPFYVDLEGVISVDSWFDEVFSSWRAESGFLYLAGAALVFLPTDVEALAAKMNDEPDYQALQEENQHLRQEIEALKAEVERLQSESDRQKVDGEINPRKEETLYRLIIGMAQAGYLYDPNALKNSAVADIHKDLDRLGVGLGERTIRNHLNAAKDYLPPKPIKT